MVYQSKITHLYQWLSKSKGKIHSKIQESSSKLLISKMQIAYFCVSVFLGANIFPYPCKT